MFFTIDPSPKKELENKREGETLSVPWILKYVVEGKWNKRMGGEITTKEGDIYFDTAEEFGGFKEGACPDELFLSSIGGCLLTTYLYFKKKLNFQMENYVFEVEGVIKMEHGSYKISKINVYTEIEVAKKEDLKRAERCFSLAEEYCHITRTIKNSIPIEIKKDIHVKKK